MKGRVGPRHWHRLALWAGARVGRVLTSDTPRRSCRSTFSRQASYLYLFVALLCASQAQAQETAAEMQIKAAFLHKFANYVEAPGTAFADSAIPLVYGVAGSSNVYQFLTELVASQNAAGRPAQVRQVASAADLPGVHVLYVGRGAAFDADMLLAQAVAESVLTVTDTAGPQPPDSMIHFFVADDRVRFDIALAPAAAAGLRLSSRLLQVARQVTEIP